MLYAGMMITELTVDIDLCVLSSCDVSQGVHWVNNVDPLFIDQYSFLLEDMYGE
jgi:hypothetical protein